MDIEPAYNKLLIIFYPIKKMIIICNNYVTIISCAPQLFKLYQDVKLIPLSVAIVLFNGDCV